MTAIDQNTQRLVLYLDGGTIPWNGTEATGTTEALVMWDGGDEWIDVEVTVRRIGATTDG